MSRKNTVQSEELQTKLIELLNRRLADAIDLQLRSREAYWNVKGPQFLSLRALFNQVVEAVEAYANLIAGRAVQLGGKAEGTAQAVVQRSALDAYQLSSTNEGGHTEALATTLTNFGRHARYASERASELKDTDTADLLTEIARGIDTWLWLVETSQQTSN